MDTVHSLTCPVVVFCGSETFTRLPFRISQAELCFSKMKAWLRRHRLELHDMHPVEAIHRALSTVTAEDCVGWMRACGEFYMGEF